MHDPRRGALIDPVRTPGLSALPVDAWHTVDRDRLAGERIFVTGATGFVGRWLLAAIGQLNDTLDAPLRVRALTRGTAPVHADWLTWTLGDVRQYRDDEPAALIVHAALPTTAGDAATAADLHDVAVRGAEAVVSHARQAGVRRVVVLSSGAVYGPQVAPAAEHVRANDDPSADVYARAKRDVEAMFDAERAPDREIVIARLFTCIGPGYRSHPHLAHVALIEAARSGQPIALRGDGTAVRSYLFGADLGVWLLALLAARGSDVVNVGSDEAISLVQFAKIVARASGRAEADVTVGTEHDERRPCFVPDLARARGTYGLTPWTPVDRAVALTLSAGASA